MKFKIFALALASLIGAILAPIEASAQRYDDDKGRGSWWWSRKGQSALWERLGSQRVSFNVERDTIRVGRQEGRFDAVKLRFLNNDVELVSARITFGNGQTEDLRLRGRYRAGEETAVVRLGGRNGERFIRDVDLVYRSRPSFRGQAVVELWGMQDDDRGRGNVRRNDDRRESYVPPPPAGIPSRGGPAWEMLGERRVDLKLDRDVVQVGRWDGTFTRIRLKVINHDIELRDVTIVYGDGSVDSWPIRRRVRDEEEGPVFDLRGRRRVVREVIMTYRATNPLSRTTVQVWGGR